MGQIWMEYSREIASRSLSRGESFNRDWLVVSFVYQIAGYFVARVFLGLFTAKSWGS